MYKRNESNELRWGQGEQSESNIAYDIITKY